MIARRVFFFLILVLRSSSSLVSPHCTQSNKVSAAQHNDYDAGSCFRLVCQQTFALLSDLE